MTNLKTKLNVPLLDLNPQYDHLKEKIMTVFEEVFDSKQFIMGPKVNELESILSKYCDSKHALGVSSGTDALVIALMALDIGHGDEVITTPFTFFATVGSISRVGATPVFVDIDPETFNIDPKKIEEKITSKTKAIIPVHLFGQMADMDPILEIAKKHKLPVIEDAAQAIGSEYTSKVTKKTHRAGSMGTMGCFSFFPSKNLGCCGDGGLVTTNDNALADKLIKLRNHGGHQRYYHDFIGGNFRIDALQAAILIEKIPYLDEQHNERIKNGEKYNTALKGKVSIPTIHPQAKTIYNQYTIRIKNREDFQTKLNENTIGNSIYYPIPLHLQKCFENLGYKQGDFPFAEQAAKEVISIPIYAGLSEEQTDYVIDTILNIVG